MMKRCSFVLGLALSTIHCSGSNVSNETDEPPGASGDALTVTASAIDANFAAAGKLVVDAPLYPAADGTFASARVNGDVLTFQRFTKDGAPLSSFAAATAQIRTVMLGGDAYHAPKITICDVGVASNGTVYATGAATATMLPNAAPYSWGFAVVISADGSKVRSWVDAGASTQCQRALPTGDGRLLVQFGSSVTGYSAVVPLAPTSSSSGKTAFSEDPAVTDARNNIRVDGTAFAIGNATAVNRLELGGPLKGFQIVQFLPFLKQLKFVKTPFRKMHVDASAIVLLTEDNTAATYDLDGNATGSVALGAPPAQTAWSDAVRDASGRTWAVADHVITAQSDPMRRTIVRRLANGSPDTGFGTIDVTGAAADLPTSVIVQGDKLVVGGKTANGYEYVRLK